MRFARALLLLLICCANCMMAAGQVQTPVQARWIQGSISDVGYGEFSPDGKLFAYQSQSLNYVQVFNSSGGFIRRISTPIVGSGTPSPICFSPDSSSIWVHGGNGILASYDAISGARKQNVATVSHVILGQMRSPDGKYVAVTDSSGLLSVFQLSDGTIFRTSAGFAVPYPNWSPDSTSIIGGIAVLNNKTGSIIHLKGRASPNEIAFRPPFVNSGVVMVRDVDHFLSFFNIATGDPVKYVDGTALTNLFQVTPRYACSGDGRYSYAGITTRDQSGLFGSALAVFDSVGTVLTQVSTDFVGQTSAGTSNPVVNPKNDEVWMPVAAGSGDNSFVRIAVLKRSSTGIQFDRYVTSREASPTYLATGVVNKVPIVATLGNRAVVGHGGTEVHQAVSGALLYRLNVQNTNGVSENVFLNFSPGGKFVAVAGQEVGTKSTEGIFLYDAMTGAKLSQLVGQFTSVVFTSDNRLVVTSTTGGRIDEVNISTSNALSVGKQLSVNTGLITAFSGDRSRVFTSGFKVYDSNTGVVVSTVPVATVVDSAAFASDGSLVTARWDSSVASMVIEKWSIQSSTAGMLLTPISINSTSGRPTQKLLAAQVGDYLVHAMNMDSLASGPFQHRLIRLSDMRVITLDPAAMTREGLHAYGMSVDGQTYFVADPNGDLFALAVPPMILSVVASPTTLTGGSSVAVTVMTTTAAPPAGSIVSLASNNSLISVPATLSIASGQTIALSLKTLPVSTNTTVRITATINGTSKFVDVVLTPPILNLFKTSNPTSKGGLPLTATVGFSAPVPIDTIVTLTSSNAVVQLPPTVKVAAGATSTTFSVPTKSVAATTVVNLTASSGTTTLKYIQTLTPPLVTSFALTASSAVGGSSLEATVSLDASAPGGGLSIVVNSTNAAVLGLTYVIPANLTGATFSLDTNPVLADTTVPLSIAGSTIAPASASVTAPKILAVAASKTSIKAGGTSTLTVILSGPAPAGFVLNIAVTAGLTVSASTLTIPAGSQSATVTITAAKPRSVSSSTVTVSRSGVSMPIAIRLTN